MHLRKKDGCYFLIAQVIFNQQNSGLSRVAGSQDGSALAWFGSQSPGNGFQQMFRRGGFIKNASTASA